MSWHSPSREELLREERQNLYQIEARIRSLETARKRIVETIKIYEEAAKLEKETGLAKPGERT